MLTKHQIQKKVFKSFVLLVKPFEGLGLNSFSPVRYLGNAVLSAMKPKSVNIHGNTILLDPHDSLRLSIRGTYEPFASRLFVKAIQKGSTVIDVGAHIGYYTLLAAQAVGPAGTVFAFEPDKSNFALLSKNIRNNRYRNVHLINKAVTDRNKTVKLYLSPVNDAAHSLIRHNNFKEVAIEGVSLDSFLKNSFRNISVIKVDTEGGDYDVVFGMKNLIKHYGGLSSLSLFTELWPKALERAGKSPNSYVELLRRLDFEILILDEEQKKLIPYQPQSLSQIYRNNPDWHVNLLAIKK